MSFRWLGMSQFVVATVAVMACSSSSPSGGSSGGSSNPAIATTACSPGILVACSCAGKLTENTTCAADGSHLLPCSCTPPAPLGSAGSLGAGAAGTTGLPISTQPGAAGFQGIAGSGFPPVGMGGTSAPTIFPPAGAAGNGIPGSGFAGTGFPGTGAAGTVAAAGISGAAGAAGTAAAAGAASDSGLSADELSMLRQTCVDEINRYRAMLPNLKVLKRATAAQEMCSDKGAQMDGDSMKAHGSAIAGLCRSVGLGAEDSCPGWGVGGFTGNATVADALKNCLMSMWGEGEPPVSRQACEQDSAGCFEKYGHYLNMSDPNSGSVACSFYKMKSGSWWMSQDFSY